MDGLRRKTFRSEAAVGYENLFRRREDGTFVHDYSGALRENRRVEAHSDVAVLRSGKVSITPVRLAHTAPLAPEQRRALEGGGND